MKRLSLLLLLSIAGQSAFGLNIQEWNVKLQAFKQAVTSETADASDLLARITDLETSIQAIPAQGQATNLEFVYDQLIAGFKNSEYSTNLNDEAKADSKAVILGFLAQLKEEVKGGKGTWAVDRLFNALGATKAALVSTATAATNKALYGAAVAVNFANEHRKATLGTVVGTAALAAAYRNKTALISAGQIFGSWAKEQAPKAGSALRSAGFWTREQASKAWASVPSKSSVDSAVSTFGTAVADKASKAGCSAYDATNSTLVKKAAKTLGQAGLVASLYPKTTAAVTAATGSAAAVSSAMAAVKVYNKVATYLAARKAARSAAAQ